MLGLVGATIWFAPAAAVRTPLRDVPLAQIFAGIDGRLTSGGAAWHWLGGIEYRDVVLTDRQGRAVACVPRAVLQRGLLGLAAAWLSPGVKDLGKLQVLGAEMLVEVRHGGSGLEDILAPWLASASAGGAPAVSLDIEVIDAGMELVDLPNDDSWRVNEILAAGTVKSGGANTEQPLAGWTAAGRVQHGGRPAAALDTAAVGARSPGDQRRLDRTTITAGATAALAREGGWSVSSPARQAAGEPWTLAVATNRLPLGVSRVWAARFAGDTVMEGLADIRLDLTVPVDTEATRVVGSVAGTSLAIRHAASDSILATTEKCEIPLDVFVAGDVVTIRELKAISPFFKAEASGRLRLPRGGSWEWGEALVRDDFAIAADLDLAAVAKALPGGIAVRPDVRVTGGDVQVSAAAHPDGKDRVLEVRVTSRDLAAVQHAVDGERLLRWNEPFTAWLRGRRGPAPGDRLQIEEARIASPAIEVAAAGTAAASTVQWTIDIDALLKEAAEVLDLGRMKMAGSARGTLQVGRVEATGALAAKFTTSLADFSVSLPGRRPWSDKEMTVTAEGEGSPAGAAWLVDRASAKVVADDDLLDCTLTGGALVDPQAIVRAVVGAADTAGRAFVRAAPQAESVAAEWTIAGDVGRWQTRLESLAGMTVPVTLDGAVKASAALTASGGAWQVTRATAEIEKLTAAAPAAAGGQPWQIDEPRLVASAAGLFDPATGAVQISSAEVLTATLSLRTGGVVITSRPQSAAVSLPVLEQVRGKVQWQADVGRLEKWCVAPLVAARWPASGRAWGTAEVLDTPQGVNLLVEATASQIALAAVPPAAALGVAGGVAPQPVWSEPEASLVIEITQPHAGTAAQPEQVTIDRLAIRSSTLAVMAAGGVSDLSARRVAEITGTISYDWDQVTRLLMPWTGGRVRLAGGGPRPFAVRGPLGTAGQLAAEAAQREAGSGQHAALVPLPDDWLAASRGDAGAGRVALPVTAPSRDVTLADRMRSVAIDTSTTWTAADLDGVRIEPGEMAVRLFEGQLAFGPFDVGVAGGRVRGSPWIKLLPLPGEVVIPPGRVIDRVALSRELCDRWASWVAPLFGRSTHTEGLVSVDLGGARIPLGDPFGGELFGQVLFERLEVTPGEHAQPLVNLIARLQTAIDPRFAFGDKKVLLSVRPEPVRVRLAERRLWHDGLVMDTGRLVMKTNGSVGADGSLAMTAELAFRGDIAGQTPVVAQLLRTPLVIPLRGTVNRPQFDAAQIDTILARIVENTAEAVINDGLSRGLEALFGKPQ